MSAPTTATAAGVALALGLEREPFAAGSDEVHLATRALERRESLVEKLLTGPARIVALVDAPGAGKSTLVQRVAARLRDRARVIHLPVSGTLGPAAVVRRLTELSPVPCTTEPSRALVALRASVATSMKAGLATVLVVDDAGCLTPGALELVANLAARWAGDGLRVLLCAEPPLLLTLEEFGGRSPIPVRVVDLPPLDAAETGDLIHLHLHLAGLRGDSPFDSAQVARIALASGGRPGRIGTLALELLAEHAGHGAPTWRRRAALAVGLAALAGIAWPLGRRGLRRRDSMRSSSGGVSEENAAFSSRVIR